MDDNALDKVITGCIAAGLGSILVCSFVIPTIADMLGNITLDKLNGENNANGLTQGDIDTWRTLITLTVMLVIVGLIIAIVRGFAVRSR